ncbi:hypothetical protein C8R47DRAFT_1063620 [Mycena vitilis]|nr:hypothetical protein C8R47DRAFT_1063620 [Mycena vitilis]
MDRQASCQASPSFLDEGAATHVPVHPEGAVAEVFRISVAANDLSPAFRGDARFLARRGPRHIHVDGDEGDQVLDRLDYAPSVIGRLHDPMGRLDAFNIPYPAPLSIPGESVAMLEIMHRICRSIGFPCTNDIFYPLTRSTLLPFIEAANISRSVMNTSRDYFPYDAYGQPIHAEYLFFVVGDPPLPRENDIDEEPVGLLSGRRVVWVQSLAPGDVPEQLTRGVPFLYGLFRIELFFFCSPLFHRSLLCVAAPLPTTFSRSSSSSSRGSPSPSLFHRGTMPDQGGKARRSTRKSTVPSRDIPSASVSHPPSSRSKARRKDGGDESDSDFPPPHGSSHASGFPPGFETAEELARMPPSDSSRNGPPMKKPKGARPSSPVFRRPKTPSFASLDRGSTNSSPSISSKGKARERPPAVVDLLEVPIEPWVTTSRNQFDFPVTFLPVEPPLERWMEYTPLSSAVIAQRAEAKEDDADLPRLPGCNRHTFGQETWLLSSQSKWIFSGGETDGELVSRWNELFLSLAAFVFRHREACKLDPLPEDPDDPTYLEGFEPRPVFEPPRIPKEPAMKPAEAYGSMEEYIASAGAFGAIVAAWHAEKTKLVTEAEDRHRALVSEWEARHALFVEQVPIVHAKASADIERYNTVRQREYIHYERVMNSIADFLLFRIRASFPQDDSDSLLSMVPPPRRVSAPIPPPRSSLTSPPVIGKKRDHSAIDGGGVADPITIDGSDSDDAPIVGKNLAKSGEKRRPAPGSDVEDSHLMRGGFCERAFYKRVWSPFAKPLAIPKG